MTHRCHASMHIQRDTQRDNHARRIIRRRINGKMIGQTAGACTAWFWRTVRGRYHPRQIAARARSRCLRSVRQVLHNPA